MGPLNAEDLVLAFLQATAARQGRVVDDYFDGQAPQPLLLFGGGGLPLRPGNHAHWKDKPKSNDVLRNVLKIEQSLRVMFVVVPCCSITLCSAVASGSDD